MRAWKQVGRPGAMILAASLVSCARSHVGAPPGSASVAPGSPARASSGAATTQTEALHSPPPAVTAPAFPAPVTDAARALAAARAALVAAGRAGTLGPADFDRCDDHPVRAYYDALGAYLTLALDARVAPGERDTELIAAALLDPLRGITDANAASDASEAWGALTVAGIERPREAPAWLAILTRVPVPGCDGDAGLFIARHDGATWRFVIVDPPLDGFCAREECVRREGAFEARLVGAQDPDGPFVLELRGLPGGHYVLPFEYRVLAPGLDARRPRVLASDSRACLNIEPPFWQVTLRADGFEIQSAFVRTGPRIDHGLAGIRTCLAYDRYVIHRGRVRHARHWIDPATCEVSPDH